MNASRATESEGQENYQKAIEAQRRSDWKTSIAYLEISLSANPTNARYLASIGDAKFMLGRIEEAMRAYRAALSHAPTDQHSLNNLAVILGQIKQHEEAEQLLQRALAFKPDEIETLLNLCSTLEHFDFRESEAVGYARRAVEVAPRDPRPYRYLAKALLRLGNLPTALDALRTAAALSPDDAEIHYGIGVIQAELDRIPQAVQAFQTALTIDPEHGKTYYALADFLYRLGELEGATEACLHAKAYYDDKISSEFLLAKTLFALGRFDEAKQTYDTYRDLYHQHRSRNLGKAHPGGKALSLPVISVTDWCSQKNTPIHQLIPGFECSMSHNLRFGNFPPELEDPPSKVPDAFVAEISNAVIIPGHEIILVENESIALYDRLCHLQDRNNLMEDDVVRLVAPERIIADLGPTSARTIKAGIFLLNQFWYNYAHWLLEVLPRLALIESCPEYRSLPLLVNEKLYPQQLDALQMLNRYKNPIEVMPIGKCVRVGQLIYPSNLTTSMLMRYRPFAPASSMDVALHPKAVEFLRERLIPSESSNIKKERRIWVSRKTKRQAGNRRMINEEEIEHLFTDAGFEIITPETLSFREQVDTFAGAAMIAGCAGAGMINSIFSPADTRILMFTKNHPQVNFHYFSNIAAAAGQSIAYVCGETLQNFGVHGFEADFQVSPQVARQAIREFLEA